MIKNFILPYVNGVLGEYFENFDPSQLQMSLGEISLSDLTLKKSIFSELGLPFKLKAGRCGTLNIKTPWTTIFSQPSEMILRDVFLLVVPESSQTYDLQKEQEQALKRKLKTVEQIEASASNSPDDPDKPEKAGYLMRCLMCILANIKIQIESIHIRYEDEEQTCKFGVGILLSSLSILTTDSKWNLKFKPEHDNFVHKVVNLEGLALYWNSYTTHFSELTEVEILLKLKEAMREEVQSTLDFMIGPIRTTTKVAFIISPEKGPNPFSTPRTVFQTVVDEIALGLNKHQFQNIIQLAESIDFMLRRQNHRKFRPNVSYKDHYREWWKFAFDCIIEEIERKRNAFRWSHIKQSGQDARDYEKLLRRKNSTTLTHDQEEELKTLESRLTIFNIVRIRKLVDLRIAKTTRASYWFVPSWFTASEIPDEKSFLQQLTSEEKSSLEKMLRANEATFPPDYEVFKSDFLMENLKVTLRSTSSPIMILHISNLQIHSTHTYATNNLTGELNSITATGSANNKFISKVETESEATSTNLLDFDLKKSGSIYDLVLRGESLEVIYDFDTIQNLINCFHIKQNVSIQMIQAKALEKYRDLKELSKKNIKKTLKESRFSIDVMLEAPRFIFPEGGQLIPSKRLDLLMVNLGSVKMESVANSSNREFSPLDTHAIQLTGFQIIFKAHDITESTQIVKSDPIRVAVEHCIEETIEVPKLRISVLFPSISFIIKETFLLRVFRLLVTLPIPSVEAADEIRVSLQTNIEEIDPYMFHNTDSSASLFVQNTDSSSSSQLVANTDQEGLLISQRTNILLELFFNEIRLFVKTSVGSKVLVKLEEISATMTLKTYGTTVDVNLRNIKMTARLDDDERTFTLMRTHYDESIVKVHLFIVSPYFPNKALLKQHMKIDVGEMDITLLKEVADDLADFARSFVESASSSICTEPNFLRNVNIIKDGHSKKQSVPTAQEAEVELKIEAQLSRLTVKLKTRSGKMTDASLKLKGLNCSWIQKPDKLDIFLKLCSLSITNLDTNLLFPEVLSKKCV